MIILSTPIATRFPIFILIGIGVISFELNLFEITPSAKFSGLNVVSETLIVCPKLSRP